MLPTTRFTDPAAVEAWDSWFRWRDGSGLRDLDIDATWWRVANALAVVEGPFSPLLVRHLVNAFCRWSLLPDERLLQYAGTDTRIEELDSPAAVLNVAAFVSSPLTGLARFDRDSFMATAGLAVHLLDNALTLFSSARLPVALSIGVIGLTDAMRYLGCPLSSTEAREHAREIAMCLAEGCLRGSVLLASERGSPVTPSERSRLAERWRERGMPESLVADALAHGVRHTSLTAIQPHPRLAALANNVADAATPARYPTWQAPAPAGGPMQFSAAQGNLLAAMQPWIDAPIRASGISRTEKAPRI